jgi:molecular chaperone GrpE
MKENEEEQPKVERRSERRIRAERELKELRRQLEDLQKEKDEIFSKYQRVNADYANFQKRAPRQIAESVAYEKEALVRTLLPGLDSFNHALAERRSAENTEAVFKGMRIVYEQLLDILRSHGVEQIQAVGRKFDPAVHQAIMQKTVLDEEDGIILEEFQKGYKLNGRTIRPSKVIVNKLTAEQQPEDEEAVTDDFDQTTQWD